MSSRQEEKEQRKHERVEREAAAAAAAKRKRLLQIVGGVVVGVAIVVGVVLAIASGGGERRRRRRRATAELARPPRRRPTASYRAFPDEGSSHVDEKLTPADYKTNPPTSGDHVPPGRRRRTGVYAPGNEPEIGNWVHTLEHGRILFQYKPGTPPSVVAQLEKLFNEDVPTAAAPTTACSCSNNTKMPFEVAAVAWRHYIGCAKFTPKAIDAMRAFREVLRRHGAREDPVAPRRRRAAGAQAVLQDRTAAACHGVRPIDAPSPRLLLVVAGLIVWLAAPALSSQPFVPRAVEFEQALDTSAWSRGADGGWRSAGRRARPSASTSSACAGARPRPSRRRAHPRARRRQRRWSAGRRWPATTPAAPGAEPVWAGGADAYQLRMDATRPRGLRAHFVNATGTATARDAADDRAAPPRARRARRARRRAGARADAGAGSRARRRSSRARQWGADQCGRRAPRPTYGDGADRLRAPHGQRQRLRAAGQRRDRAVDLPLSPQRRTAGATSATTSSSTATGRSSRAARAASTRP